MAMSLGNRGQQATINVTPMIDILLVLIIIFMVVTPTTSHGLNALVPQSESGAASAAPSDDVVLTVNGNGTVSINAQVIAMPDLHVRLERLFVDHPHHPLFVRGGKDLAFEQVAQVIDIARGVGLDRIALMTQ
jgi:biopolymer transport protein TolR